ncbi:hypothetical protein ACS0TY_018505 [Phlomoides rotata]
MKNTLNLRAVDEEQLQIFERPSRRNAGSEGFCTLISDRRTFLVDLHEERFEALKNAFEPSRTFEGETLDRRGSAP